MGRVRTVSKLAGLFGALALSAGTVSTAYADSLPTNTTPPVVVVDNNVSEAVSTGARVYSWKDTDIDFTGAKVIVVHRDAVAGAKIAPLATKDSNDQYDPAAFANIASTSFARKLIDAYNSGAVIVVDGNDDGALSDALVYKLFGVHGAVENHADGFRALAIQKSSITDVPFVMALYYPFRVPVSRVLTDVQNQIRSNLGQLGSAQTNNSLHSDMLPRGRNLSLDTTVGGGSLNGSGNYYTYTNLYVLGDGDVLTGQLKVTFQIQRSYHDPTYSEWQVKVSQESSVYSGTGVSPQVTSTWFGVTNNYTSTQKLLSAGPNPTNPNYQVGVSAAVNLTPREPNNNSLQFQYSWTYPVNEVNVTESAYQYSSYGWGHYYLANSPAATQVQTNQPGFDIDNTAGYLVFNIDNKLNMTDTLVSSYSTGDKGDTLAIADF